MDGVLAILKIDLQISVDAYDDYLQQIINAAEKFIETEGITLDATRPDDVYLVAMYAAWLYRQRREMSGPAMPRALRWALNNRLFSQKAGS